MIIGFVLCSQDAAAATRRAVGAFGRPALEPAALHVAGRHEHHRLRVEHQPGRAVAGPAAAAAAPAPVAAAAAAAADDHRPAPYRSHQPVVVHVTATAGAPQTVHVIQPASPADHRRLVKLQHPHRRDVIYARRSTSHRASAAVLQLFGAQRACAQVLVTNSQQSF